MSHQNVFDCDFLSVIQGMKEVGLSLLEERKTADIIPFSYKQKKEVVSQIDRTMELKIRAIIKNACPNYKVWGEELGRDKGDLTKDSFVIIDPIDGTKNYLSKNPLFATQIAGVFQGEIAWSIINLPGLGELYYAINEEGAYCNDERIFGSTQTQLDLANQCFGIGHDPQNFLELPKIISGHLAEPRHYGCAGVHYSFMACGRTDIYIAQEAAFYDAAPGLLLCKEAGLSFCQLDGSEYPWGENDLGLVIAPKILIEQFKKVVSSH